MFRVLVIWTLMNYRHLVVADDGKVLVKRSYHFQHPTFQRSSHSNVYINIPSPAPLVNLNPPILHPRLSNSRCKHQRTNRYYFNTSPRRYHTSSSPDVLRDVNELRTGQSFSAPRVDKLNEDTTLNAENYTIEISSASDSIPSQNSNNLVFETEYKPSKNKTVETEIEKDVKNETNENFSTNVQNVNSNQTNDSTLENDVRNRTVEEIKNGLKELIDTLKELRDQKRIENEMEIEYGNMTTKESSNRMKELTDKKSEELGMGIQNGPVSEYNKRMKELRDQKNLEIRMGIQKGAIEEHNDRMNELRDQKNEELGMGIQNRAFEEYISKIKELRKQKGVEIGLAIQNETIEEYKNKFNELRDPLKN